LSFQRSKKRVLNLAGTLGDVIIKATNKVLCDPLEPSLPAGDDVGHVNINVTRLFSGSFWYTAELDATVASSKDRHPEMSFCGNEHAHGVLTIREDISESKTLGDAKGINLADELEHGLALQGNIWTPFLKGQFSGCGCCGNASTNNSLFGLYDRGIFGRDMDFAVLTF
jgi:hypothetical protein